MSPTNPSSVPTPLCRSPKRPLSRIPFILLLIAFIPSCARNDVDLGPGPQPGFPATFEPILRRYETPIRAFVTEAGSWREIEPTSQMMNDPFLQDPGAALPLGFSIRLESDTTWTMVRESGEQKGSSYQRSESGTWRFRDPRWTNSIFFVSTEEFHLRVHSVAFEVRDDDPFSTHTFERRYHEPGKDPLLEAEGLDGDTLVLRVFDEMMVQQ